MTQHLTILPIQYQVAQGIDAVIVDSVLGITNGLIQRQNKGERTPGPSPIPVPVGDSATMRVPLLENVKQTAPDADLKPSTIL